MASRRSDALGLEIPVRCGGSRHRLRLEGDELSAPAHLGDAALERALAAVAGTGCQCLEVLDKWERGDAAAGALPELLLAAATRRAVRALDDGDHSARDGSLLRELAIADLTALAAHGKRFLDSGSSPRTLISVSLTPSGPAEVTGAATAQSVRMLARLPWAWWPTVWKAGHNDRPGRFYTTQDQFVRWERDASGVALRTVTGTSGG